MSEENKKNEIPKQPVNSVVDLGNSSSVVANESPDKLTFSWNEHQYLVTMTTFADQKAAFTFAFAIGCLTLGYNFGLYGRLAGRGEAWIGTNLLSVIAAAPVIICAGLCLYSLVPRLWSKKRQGLVYFGHIAAFAKAAEYSSAIRAASVDGLLVQVSEHNFDLAAIALKKFDFIKYALWAGVLGGFFTLVAVLVTISAGEERSTLQTLDSRGSDIISALDVNVPDESLAERIASFGSAINSSETLLKSGADGELLLLYRQEYSVAIRLLAQKRLVGQSTVTTTGNALRAKQQQTPPVDISSNEAIRLTETLRDLFRKSHATSFERIGSR